MQISQVILFFIQKTAKNMKKIALILTIFLATTMVYSQDLNFKKEGSTYKIESTKTKREEVKTGFTFEDNKGKTYDIYIGPSGACYIKKISSKSGEEYKQYLNKEISKDICKSLNIEYKGKE